MFRFLGLFLVIFCATSAASFMLDSDSYRAPTCGPKQSCSQQQLPGGKSPFFLPDLAMCTCPPEQQCRDEFAITMQDTKYIFCEAVALQRCSHREIAVVLHGLQSTIRCYCPEEMTVVRSDFFEKRSLESLHLSDIYFECVNTA